MRRLVGGLFFLALGCGSPPPDTIFSDAGIRRDGGMQRPPANDGGRPDAGLAPSYERRELGRFALSNGLTAPIAIEVPPGARSMQIIVRGASSATLAIASLITPDRGELVTASDPRAALIDSVAGDDRTADLRTGLAQVATAGASVLTFPNDASEFVPGIYRVRIMSTEATGEVRVAVVTPPDDGAATLHVNVHDFALEVTRARIDTVMQETATILQAAGLRLVVDEVIDHGVSPYNDIYCYDDVCPIFSPGSKHTQMVRIGRERSRSRGLDLYVVDSDPTGGTSLGIGGADDPESDYFGVFIHAPNANDESLASQVVAHEFGHFLGLWHVYEEYPDPLPDTDDAHTGGTCTNLMSYCGIETGLTPGQVRTMRRSPLMRPE